MLPLCASPSELVCLSFLGAPPSGSSKPWGLQRTPAAILPVVDDTAEDPLLLISKAEQAAAAAAQRMVAASANTEAANRSAASANAGAAAAAAAAAAATAAAHGAPGLLPQSGEANTSAPGQADSIFGTPKAADGSFPGAGPASPYALLGFVSRSNSSDLYGAFRQTTPGGGNKAAEIVAALSRAVSRELPGAAEVLGGKGGFKPGDLFAELAKFARAPSGELIPGSVFGRALSGELFANADVASQIERLNSSEMFGGDAAAASLVAQLSAADASGDALQFLRWVKVASVNADVPSASDPGAEGGEGVAATGDASGNVPSDVDADGEVIDEGGAC